MAKKYYVFSKMACDVSYNDYIPGGADLPIKTSSVLIKGGAGVANDRIITPLGICTEVTEEQVSQLNANGIFKLHRDNGFVTIESKNQDVEKVVADMTVESDPSSPLTPEDYRDVLGAKPVGLDK